MCLMICGNVSSLFFLRSREKEVAAANRVHNARFRPGFSTNTGLDANRLRYLPTTAQKYCPRALPMLEQRQRYGRDFHILLAEYEKKVSIDAQWQLWMAPCCKPRHALKNQRLRASGQPDRQNIKQRQDPSL